MSLLPFKGRSVNFCWSGLEIAALRERRRTCRKSTGQMLVILPRLWFGCYPWEIRHVPSPQVLVCSSPKWGGGQCSLIFSTRGP